MEFFIENFIAKALGGGHFFRALCESDAHLWRQPCILICHRIFVFRFTILHMRYLGRILGIIALRSRESYSLVMTNRPFSILFVCTGNIWRSPTAEAVLRQQVRKVGLEYRIRVDSAGTHGYHVGEPPDPRSAETSLARGVDMRDL